MGLVYICIAAGMSCVLAMEASLLLLVEPIFNPVWSFLLLHEEPGPWTLGKKYKWINPAAIIWVAICVVIFCLPFTPAAVPWRDEFDIKYLNYAPVTVGGLLLIVGVWWAVRAKHTFTGPVRTVEFDEGAGVQ